MKKLTKLAILGIIVVVVGLSGCTAKIDIVGNGDVLSESGSRNCYLETTDCQETVVGAFQETFTAVPRAGYAFDGWDYCQKSAGNVCTFDVDAATVQKAWNQTLPAVVARFVPASDTSLKLETLNTVVQACDSSPILPRERHCAIIEGREGGVSVRPDYKTLTIYYIDNLPFEGEYLVLDDGWTFTGRYIFEGGATHTIAAQRTGDRLVISKWVVGSDHTYYIRFIMEVSQ